MISVWQIQFSHIFFISISIAFPVLINFSSFFFICFSNKYYYYIHYFRTVWFILIIKTKKINLINHTIILNLRRRYKAYKLRIKTPIFLKKIFWNLHTNSYVRESKEKEKVSGQNVPLLFGKFKNNAQLHLFNFINSSIFWIKETTLLQSAAKLIEHLR